MPMAHVEITDRSWPMVKVGHALDQARVLRRQVGEWEDGGHVWLDLTLSDDGRAITSVLRVSELPPLVAYSLALGDVVHSARSALDSLVWELCQLTGERIEKPELVQFPIASTGGDFRSRKRALVTMPNEQLGRIRSIQPFAQPSGGGDVLSLVRDISNTDKHRGAVPSNAVSGSISFPIVIPRAEPNSSPKEILVQMDQSPWVPELKDGAPSRSVFANARIGIAGDRGTVVPKVEIVVKGVRLSLKSFLVSLESLPDTIRFICGGAAEPRP